VVGISADPWDRQKMFDEANQLGFILLSDPDRGIAKQFGVKRIASLPNRRRTFVIGSDREVLAVIATETDMRRHGDEALKALSAIQ
jgi:peroxiredoxin Q/BCP